MASKGSGRAKSSKGRRLARASKRGTRYSLRSAHPLQNSQALESKSIVSSQANASGGLDSRELQASRDFIESKAGHGLQDSKNTYKSQKNHSATESNMQLESGSTQCITNDKELQNPPVAPTYAESKIKSIHKAGLESKAPQSIQASQDKDPKKEQSKNEDLQSIAAREGERDQKIQAIQAAPESNAKLDFQESNPTKTFIKPSPSHGGLQNLQATCNPCKSQEGKSAIESKMQLKSEDLKNITTEEKSYQKNQATSSTPTYTESNIKSSHRAGLESKIPQSIQASQDNQSNMQDKDSKKEQLKNEDLQGDTAKEGERDQTSHPTKAQAITESKTKSSLDFQTIQSPQTAAIYTESKESQMQIPFEILGFDSHSTLQLVSLQAARHGISLFASKEGGILLAKGHSYGLDGFFAEVSALFGEKLLKGELASFLVEKLATAALSLCVAESCTGGLISSIITGVPGASRIYKGGVVTYSATSKQKILGVRESTIKECGVYSQKCVMEMARGALDLFGADIAIATSGLASSDTSADNFLKLPPGLVFTCVLRRGHLPIATEQHHLKGGMESNLDSRHLVQKQASLEAIRLVFEALRA